MKIKDFVFASRVSEACSLLREIGDSAYIIAGGTSSFFINSKSPKVAIDINRVPIKGICRDNDTFRVGACTTINDILKHKEPGWVLDRVALKFVNQQVRNISTIGGNISRIFYWSDFPVAVRVLEGAIKLSGISSKNIKISEAFHNATVHKGIFKGALLEYIEIPVIRKGMGFGYSKESRTSEAFSAATAAAFVKVDDGVISDARIAIGAVLPFPVRLFDLEEALKGKKSESSSVKGLNFDKLNKYSLLPREGMSMDYCKHLLKVKISDVVCDALKEAVGGCNA
jgi:carbon-monoxide dehydrogenase medium subunit